MSKQTPGNEGIPATVGEPSTKQADTSSDDTVLRTAEEQGEKDLTKLQNT